MRLETKEDARHHLESMKGPNGVIVELYDEIILRMPTRDSQYKAALAEREPHYGAPVSFPLQYEDVNKFVKNAVSGVWELYAMREGKWIPLR